ncbi:MAG: hypothetical protein RR238_10665 [Lachnospiraceae bacterium]
MVRRANRIDDGCDASIEIHYDVRLQVPQHALLKEIEMKHVVPGKP